MSVPIERVKGLVRRDDTIARLDVCATMFPMTWLTEDRQLVSPCDGVTLSDPPKAYHSYMYRVTGDPPNPKLSAVAGYPDMPLRLRESDYASFWTGPCLAVDGYVYQYLYTSNHPYLLPDQSFWPDFYLAHTKLIFSPDEGRTWHNQDGSSPVVWENWDAVSQDNMAFFNEQPEGAFTSLTFLQMGRNYELNRDGYVYVYSGNGGEDGTANQLVMFRVPKSRVLDRGAYEYFSGLHENGSAAWTRDISARVAMHTFPRGWVSGKMPGAVPLGWCTSVVYNAPLGVYLMAAQGTGPGPTGGWFGKPSYLGFWVSPTPWGPFAQIHEETAWTPANELGARAFAPQIAPKWISADGRSFWLVWSDYGMKGDYAKDSAGEFNPDKAGVDALKHISDDVEFARSMKASLRSYGLNFYFNMQQVDLIVE